MKIFIIFEVGLYHSPQFLGAYSSKINAENFLQELKSKRGDGEYRYIDEVILDQPLYDQEVDRDALSADKIAEDCFKQIIGDHLKHMGEEIAKLRVSQNSEEQ